MSKHTPGPWKQAHRQGADGMYRTEVFSEEHGGIATCDWTPKHCGNGVTGTYREGNAALIAAAPDLLAVVEKLNEAINCGEGRISGEGKAWNLFTQTIVLTAKALVKARGES